MLSIVKLGFQCFCASLASIRCHDDIIFYDKFIMKCKEGHDVMGYTVLTDRPSFFDELGKLLQSWIRERFSPELCQSCRQDGEDCRDLILKFSSTESSG